MGVGNWIIGIVLILGLLYYVEPELITNPKVGTQSVISDVKGKIGMEITEELVEELSLIPSDLGMPFIETVTNFTLCTSNNICERIWPGSFCNTSNGHCYK